LNPGQRRGRLKSKMEQAKRHNSKAELKAKLLSEIKRKQSEFEEWIGTTKLQQKQQKRYIRTISRIWTMEDLERALEGSKNDRLALRAFIRFLEEEGYIDEYEAGRFRKIVELPQTGVDTRIYSDADIRKVFRKAQIKNDKTKELYLKLVVYSGLRKIHALEAFNRLASGAEFRKLGNIAVLDLNIQHNTKKAIVCVCPARLARAIQNHATTLSANQIHKLNQKGVLFNAIRKWFYTTARRLEIPSDVVDYWQGRSIRSIGAKHYLDMLEMTKIYYPRLAKHISDNIHI